MESDHSLGGKGTNYLFYFYFLGGQLHPLPSSNWGKWFPPPFPNHLPVSVISFSSTNRTYLIPQSGTTLSLSYWATYFFSDITDFSRSVCKYEYIIPEINLTGTELI